jgi:hypothetical protein
MIVTVACSPAAAAVRLRPVPREGSNRHPGLQAKRNVVDNRIEEAGMSRTWDGLGSSRPKGMGT